MLYLVEPEGRLVTYSRKRLRNGLSSLMQSQFYYCYRQTALYSTVLYNQPNSQVRVYFAVGLRSALVKRSVPCS